MVAILRNLPPSLLLPASLSKYFDHSFLVSLLTPLVFLPPLLSWLSPYSCGGLVALACTAGLTSALGSKSGITWRRAAHKMRKVTLCRAELSAPSKAIASSLPSPFLPSIPCLLRKQSPSEPVTGLDPRLDFTEADKQTKAVARGAHLPLDVISRGRIDVATINIGCNDTDICHAPDKHQSPAQHAAEANSNWAVHSGLN